MVRVKFLLPCLRPLILFALAAGPINTGGAASTNDLTVDDEDGISPTSVETLGAAGMISCWAGAIDTGDLVITISSCAVAIDTWGTASTDGFMYPKEVGNPRTGANEDGSLCGAIETWGAAGRGEEDKNSARGTIDTSRAAMGGKNG